MIFRKIVDFDQILLKIKQNSMKMRKKDENSKKLATRFYMKIWDFKGIFLILFHVREKRRTLFFHFEHFPNQVAYSQRINSWQILEISQMDQISNEDISELKKS